MVAVADACKVDHDGGILSGQVKPHTGHLR
jgi:hypothetical protein